MGKLFKFLKETLKKYSDKITLKWDNFVKWLKEKNGPLAWLVLFITWPIRKILNLLKDFFTLNKKGLKKKWEGFFKTTAILTKIIIVFRCIIGFISLIAAAVSAFFSLGSLWSMVEAVFNPTGTITNKLVDILSEIIGSGGMGTLFQSVDNVLINATSGYITPAVSLSGAFCLFGIASVWNNIIASFISSLTFAISIQLLRWSAQRFKFTWTRKLQ